MRIHTSRTTTVFVLLALASALTAIGVVAQAPADRCVVPAAIRDAILQETSGEEAYQHVQVLAVNRNRQPEEFVSQKRTAMSHVPYTAPSGTWCSVGSSTNPPPAATSWRFVMQSKSTPPWT